MNHPTRSHEEIEQLAYQFWEARGRPCGSPEADWFKAQQELTVFEPESLLSKVAREVGSALGNAVAFLTDIDPATNESSKPPAHAR